MSSDKYTILIDYTTGDSFHSEERTDEEIGLVFENGELAVKAAELIKAHKNFIDEFERWGPTPKSVKDAMKECLKSEWYVNYCKAGGSRSNEKDWFTISNRIGFETSPGEYTHMSHPFWMGYFEHLNGIRVRKLPDEHEVEIDIY